MSGLEETMYFKKISGYLSKFFFFFCIIQFNDIQLSFRFGLMIWDDLDIFINDFWAITTKTLNYFEKENANAAQKYVSVAPLHNLCIFHF